MGWDGVRIEKLVRACFGAAGALVKLVRACCRGSGGVALRGLDRSGETAELARSSFYSKNRYTVTPTFKTPGRVSKIKEPWQQKTLIFTLQN